MWAFCSLPLTAAGEGAALRSCERDFALSPIPAGFFCARSKAFAGRVALKGVPLVTTIPGQLRDGDTIVERLDDAAFNAKGTAVTRIQVRALSLASIAPIQTACGAFHVATTQGLKL